MRKQFGIFGTHDERSKGGIVSGTASGPHGFHFTIDHLDRIVQSVQLVAARSMSAFVTSIVVVVFFRHNGFLNPVYRGRLWRYCTPDFEKFAWDFGTIRLRIAEMTRVKPGSFKARFIVENNTTTEFMRAHVHMLTNLPTFLETMRRFYRFLPHFSVLTLTGSISVTSGSTRIVFHSNTLPTDILPKSCMIVEKSSRCKPLEEMLKICKGKNLHVVDLYKY